SPHLCSRTALVVGMGVEERVWGGKEGVSRGKERQMRANRRGRTTMWGGLVLLGCLCLRVPSAGADVPRVLGLDQLVQMALERSPELKQADQDIAVAVSDLDQARAAQWAQLDVTAVGGFIDNAKKPVVVVSPTPGADGLLRGRIEKKDASGYGP